MEQTKLFKIQRALVLAFLIFFPLGQLPKLLLQLIEVNPLLLPADLIILLLAFSSLFYKNLWQLLIKSKPILFLICVTTFSWVLSFSFWGIASINPGSLYLIRLISYLVSFIILRNLIDNKYLTKLFLLKALGLVGVAIGLLGFIQYLLLPDLTQLYLYGWDDHYYRLAGSFLDPAYTGVFLVLTIILIINSSLFKETNYKNGLLLALVLALSLTYSRASYLSLFVGLAFLVRKNKIVKVLGIVLGVVVLLLVLLPNAGGEGVNLFRTNSIFQRAGNYQQAAFLSSKFPLFGVGYNNVCLAKQEFIGVSVGGRNACSGLDNSFLFLLVTTGIAGFLAFANFFYLLLWENSSSMMKASLLAVSTHAFFSNTLVYPFILFWFGCLFALEKFTESNDI